MTILWFIMAIDGFPFMLNFIKSFLKIFIVKYMFVYKLQIHYHTNDLHNSINKYDPMGEAYTLYLGYYRTFIYQSTFQNNFKNYLVTLI